ncbi:MAG: hypothetical protein JWO97_637 [Acidobacteria bacterium]|nr:hypothetical protein [Acidobacteriota bacterium]
MRMTAALARSDHARAVEEGERAVAIDPRDASTITLLAESYHELGDEDRAMALWRRAIEIDPNITEHCARSASTTRRMERSSRRARCCAARWRPSDLRVRRRASRRWWCRRRRSMNRGGRLLPIFSCGARGRRSTSPRTSTSLLLLVPHLRQSRSRQRGDVAGVVRGVVEQRQARVRHILEIEHVQRGWALIEAVAVFAGVEAEE